MSQASEIKDFYNIKVLKYPVHRIEYTYKTGSIAEKLVSDILREEGIDVEYHDVHENGVDVKAKNIDIGIEVWNWSKPHEYGSRVQSVLENLKPFQFRALVTSFISDTVKDNIIDNYVISPVLIIELGFQILPKEFKDFYKNRKDVVFYPSRQAYTKVKQKLKPLIKRIKDIGTDRILNKHFPVYEFEDIDLYDAIGCNKQEFNNFLRDLEQHREKVALITVQEPSIESPNKKLLSTKEPFNAYVYENNLNLKNESSKIRAKNREAENRRAITEEKTEGSTFKENCFSEKPISAKIRAFSSRFKTFCLNLLSSLWNDKTGNVALTKKSRVPKWKPREGFQVAPNQIQVRLMKHTYPCQYKLLVWCTELKKFKYLCKLSDFFTLNFDSYIKLYKNRWYCFCNGSSDCPIYTNICFYNMNRGEVNCKWYKTRLIEEKLIKKSIK